MTTPEQLRELIPAIRAWIQAEIDAGHTPGAAVGIVAGGEVVYTEGFGLRDMERGLPVDMDTIFAIGSCTKAFTAFGGLLVDEGKFTWDTPIHDLLPEFRLNDPVATELCTVRDLLSHQTGLPRHDFMWYGSDASREDLIKRLRYLKPSVTFRQRWQYQNLIYATAGYLVGEVANTTWEDFTQTRIFDPLAMTRSQFSVRQSETDANAALPYAFRKGAFKAVPFRSIDAVGPAGSINSTVPDMLKWVLVNLKHKPGLIADPTLRELHTPQVVIPDSPDFPWYGTSDITSMSYALGWGSVTYRGHSTLRHAGGIDGFNSSVGLLPFQDAGIVVLCNTQERDPASVIMYGMMDRVLGLDPLPWWDRFAENREKLEKQGAEQKQALIDARHADALPAHPLADYTGCYRDPGYGDFTITLEGDHLSARYNGVPLHLTHHHYDMFRMEDEDEEVLLLGSFFTDASGKVARFSCRLEPSVPAIEFTRVEQVS